MPSPLSDQLAAAWQRRTDLRAQLAAEGTTALRLFHGSSEGHPGLTVDRYGDCLLVQSFHATLTSTALAELREWYQSALPGLPLFYNDRSQGNSRVSNLLSPAEQADAERPRTFAELDLRYHFRARHAGQDPWLFLDLRAGRRRVRRESVGRSVLNLFAYTCGIGIAARQGGASSVLNVDFASASLQVGRDNAALNGIHSGIGFAQADAFAALRQLAGLGQPEVVRGRRMPAFPRMATQAFDLVVLDPPGYAKSAFGVVDLVRDYAALFKPALLATAKGGLLLCTNNVASVRRADWLDHLQRCAAKNARTIQNIEWIDPEADFPSPDGEFPLKMVLMRV